MCRHFVSIALALVLALTAATAALAQEGAMPPTLCGDLDEDDCALLTASTEAMQGVSSSVFDVEYALVLSDLPDAALPNVEIRVSADGKWAVDEAAQAAMRALSELGNSTAPGALQEMAAELPALILELYGGLSAEINVDILLSEELAEQMSAQSEVEIPANIAMDMRILEGMLYINLADFKALAPELQELNADWIAIDLAGLIQMGLAESAAAGEERAAGMGATTLFAGMAYAQLFKVMQPFVEVERLDDVAADGQAAAVFQSTPNLLAFVTSDVFRSFAQQLATLAAPPEEEISPAELEEGLMLLGFVAPLLFRDLNVSWTTTIGLVDLYVYESTVDFDWDLGSVLQLAAMSEPSLRQQMQAGQQPAIKFTVDSSFAAYNEGIEIDTPENVEIIPLDALDPVDTSSVY